MDESHREMRLASMTRGFIISALIAFYALVLDEPEKLILYSFLIGAALQMAVVISRKFVAGEYQAQWLFILELVADGATVLCFALGIYSGLVNYPYEF